MRELAIHLPWVCALGIATFSSDPSMRFWVGACYLVGWCSMIMTWKDPSEIAQKVAAFCLPIGIVVYWLMDSPQDESIGIGLMIFGSIPFWIFIASLEGSSPNVDGRDSGGG